MPTNNEPWATVEEAAESTGLPAWRIKRLAYANRIPFSKPFGKTGRLYVRVSDIHLVMDAATTPAK